MVPSPNQSTEGNSEHASVAENEAPHNVTQKEKNSRPTKWSIEEEEMLISSWLTISSDSVMGNYQTRGSFWTRVAGYFNMYRKTKFEREESQIKSHYYVMMSQTKTSESGAYTTSSNHDIEDNTYEANESESCPIGQKAAKRKMRGKEKKNVTESVAEEFNHRWKRMEELQSQKLAVLNEIKNKAKEDTLRADYEILMKDTSTMSDQQLNIHNHMCSIIKARHDIP
uniref:No apical meristem-associated C-terminal domain-containing protein n=1 Tax=Kalanchoe fedtschenkoi TaxID=63787 RepID=A0A7N0T6E1_KALFE